MITELREIAWTVWDPIGLSEKRCDGNDDEYDGYLIDAAAIYESALRIEPVVDHLFWVQSRQMGLGSEELTPVVRAKLETVAGRIAEIVDARRS